MAGCKRTEGGGGEEEQLQHFSGKQKLCHINSRNTTKSTKE